MGMIQRGHCGALGQGWMTGHQKRSEVMKKQACSTACHPEERSANS
jgi:hypothetical protein